MSRNRPESVNKNIFVHLHTPRHRGVVIEPGAMHPRFDWPSFEFSRGRLLSFAPAADGTVEHEPRSLIGAEMLVRQIHLDAFISELNRDVFVVTRHQRLDSVIAPGNGRARALQFIERYQ